MTLIIIVELKAKWLKRAACSVKISTKNSINLEEAVVGTTQQQQQTFF